jgi:hypothetical protein
MIQRNYFFGFAANSSGRLATLDKSKNIQNLRTLVVHHHPISLAIALNDERFTDL